MILTGTIVNVVAIILGGLVGSLIKGIPDRMNKTVMQGLALATMVLGVTMGMASNQFLIVIFSLVVGGVIGEILRIDDGLNQLGVQLEKKFSSNGQGQIATAFVTTTLVYCIGSMAILGSLDSGLRNDHQILFTKSMLDGVSAIIFASTLGIGVIFSSIPVLLYQGAITLSATFISYMIPPELLERMINEITATGGILILAIGFNLLEVKKIPIASFLPAIFIAALLVPLIDWVKILF